MGPSIKDKLICTVALAIAVSTTALSQEPTSAGASSIFARVAPSVFMIEARDAAGGLLRTGTGFSISGRRIVSNAHVVAPGTPYLKVGALSVPLTVISLDPINDLAVLGVEARLDARELTFASARPGIGARLYAIGNPRGLENSISEGLLSGLRVLEGRSLLQITAAISPGSSGGPIVDNNGEVVGVAVGSLTDGQNLNFAVPIELVVQLVAGKNAGNGGWSTALASARVLIQSKTPSYVDVAKWTAHQEQVKRELGVVHALAKTGDDLLEAATLAAMAGISDSTYQFANEALALGTVRVDSVRSLLLGSRIFSLRYLDKLTAAEIGKLLVVAESLLKPHPKHPVGLTARALALHELGRGPDAIAAARTASRVIGNPQVWTDYHTIVAAHGTPRQDDAAFSELRQSGYLQAHHWASHAMHLAAREEWEQSAESYVQAYDLSDEYEEYTCRAGQNFWRALKLEQALLHFRNCVQQNAVSEYPDTSNIIFAQRGLASILNDRGVYSQAESHARQALTMADGSEAAWAAIELAKALRSQSRPSEAVAAALTAVRMGDGAQSSAHFILGQAYFDLKEWEKCRLAFRNADDLAPKTTSAAYNLGICYSRDGFYREAARWMETVLEREPTRRDRADILEMIRAWRAR